MFKVGLFGRHRGLARFDPASVALTNFLLLYKL